MNSCKSVCGTLEGGSKVLCRSIVRPCWTECTRVSLVFMSEEAGIDGNSNRTVFEEVSFVPTRHSSPYLRHLVPLTIDPSPTRLLPSFDRSKIVPRVVCPIVSIVSQILKNFNPFHSYSRHYSYNYLARIESILGNSKLELSSKI